MSGPAVCELGWGESELGGSASIKHLGMAVCRTTWAFAVPRIGER